MGNRNDAVCDNLNRASSIGGVSMTHDVLGNRLTRGTGTYQWDLVNRLVETTTGTGLGRKTTRYEYRADGMRIRKSAIAAAIGTGSGPGVETPAGIYYRYDGQMLIEESEPDGTKLTRYGIGARGIEVITSGGVDSYPLYDAHGNMVATLTRAVNGGFAFAGERSFDAWGVVRAGASSGAPNQRYCASLGHVQDDETGLVYMRARYYVPGSGRFVSEDPAMDGANWLVYCENRPTVFVDPNGKTATGLAKAISAFGLGVSFTLVMCALSLIAFKEREAALATLKAAANSPAPALLGLDLDSTTKLTLGFLRASANESWLTPDLNVLLSGLEESAKKNWIGAIVVASYTAYTTLVLGALIAIAVEELHSS